MLIEEVSDEIKSWKERNRSENVFPLQEVLFTNLSYVIAVSAFRLGLIYW